MRFTQPGADVLVADGGAAEAALASCTHLAIVAHQDDAETLAFDAILACRAGGGRFGVVVATDGTGSPGAGPWKDADRETLRRARQQEQREAAALGGYAVTIQLDHPSAAAKGGPGADALREDVARILGASGAQTLHLHNPCDRHDTHVGLLARCIEVLAGLPPQRRPARVLGGEVWRDLDWSLAPERLEIPCGGEPELQAALLRVFRSQVAGKRYDLAVPARRLAHATFADSHRVDGDAGLALALDLGPVVRGDVALDVFAARAVERFREDVAARFRRVAFAS